MHSSHIISPMPYYGMITRHTKFAARPRSMMHMIEKFLQYDEEFDWNCAVPNSGHISDANLAGTVL